MKKVSLLAFGLVSLFSIYSCCKENIVAPDTQEDGLRRIDFKVQMDEELTVQTRMGIKLKPIHTWEKTKVENVHLYELEKAGSSVLREGEDVTITTEDPYEDAIFSAGFYDKIIVNPTGANSTGKTKANQTVYSYYGVIAQRNEGKFFIPAIQYPDDDTWIDPDADLVVGKLENIYESKHNKVLEGLTFSRPVAVSRLAFTNLEGEFVKSVKITSDNELTGSASFSDIDFSNADGPTVAFSDGSKTIELIFADNTKLDPTFYATFVCTVGKKAMKSVEVVTDKYIYTKDLTGKSTTFATKQFRNIAIDMTVKAGNNVTRIGYNSQPLQFKKGGVAITTDAFDMAGEEPYAAPVLEGAVEGSTVTYASDNTDVATVDESNGTVAIVGIGTAKISATASETVIEETTWSETTVSFTLTVTDSSLPTPQTLTFTPDSLGHTIGETFTEPLLEGAHTAITWSSDDEDIATVATNGKVTFTGTKAGIVTIKASAAAETVAEVNYAAAEATYKINVIIPVSNKVTYYKASTIDAGYEYLIVSNGYAVKNFTKNDTICKATKVYDALSDQITIEKNDSLLWMAAKPETELTEGVYTFTSDSKSLYRISDSGDNYLGAKELNDSDNKLSKYYLWDYSESHLYQTSGSSSVYYYRFYYEDGEWIMNYQKSSLPSDYPIYLFTARQPQTISFAAAAPEIDLATTSTYTQAVSAAKTGVTYAITDAEPSDAAVINATTGEVTASKAGQITVTATAAASSSYQGSKASYTLTIKNSNAKNYVKVTGDSIDDGTYLIVSSNYAFDATHNSSYRRSVTISDSKIEANENVDSAAVVITKSGSQYYLESIDGYVFYGDDGIELTKTKDSKCLHTASISSGDVKLKNKGSHSSEKYLYYSSTDKKFSYSSSSKNFALYLLEGSSKTARELSFAKSDVVAKLTDGTYSGNALNGHSDGASYSSDNSEVATVIASTGVVTLVGEGTVNITATCNETDTYKAESVSYSLTVVASAGTYYVKSTSIESGSTYLVLSKDKKNILKNAETNYTTLSTAAGSTISATTIGDASQLEFVISKSGDDYTFKNGDDYMICDSSTLRLTFADDVSEKTYKESVTITGDKFLFVSEKGSSYYLYFSSGNGFKHGSSGSDSCVYLYKKIVVE